MPKVINLTQPVLNTVLLDFDFERIVVEYSNADAAGVAYEQLTAVYWKQLPENAGSGHYQIALPEGVAFGQVTLAQLRNYIINDLESRLV